MDVPVPNGLGSRRNEDIALDLMKFIASTTGYGKAGAPGQGQRRGRAATVASPGLLGCA